MPPHQGPAQYQSASGFSRSNGLPPLVSSLAARDSSAYSASQAAGLQSHSSGSSQPGNGNLSSGSSKPNSRGSEPDYATLKTRVSELEFVNDLLASRVKQLEASESRIRDSEMALRSRVSELEAQVKSYELEKEKRDLLDFSKGNKPFRARSLSPPARRYPKSTPKTTLNTEISTSEEKPSSSDSNGNSNGNINGTSTKFAAGPTTSSWYASIAATANANGNGVGGFASPSFGPLGMVHGINKSARGNRRDNLMSPVFAPLNFIPNISGAKKDDTKRAHRAPLSDKEETARATSIPLLLDSENTTKIQEKEKRAATLSPQISPLMSKVMPMYDSASARKRRNSFSENQVSSNSTAGPMFNSSTSASINKISNLLSPAAAPSPAQGPLPSISASTNSARYDTASAEKNGEANTAVPEEREHSPRKKIRLSSIVQ